jgi:hypothetical protein
MQRLVLLALVALAAFPLSAHGHWRGSRRVVVVEAPCRPRHHWDEDRWERRDPDRYREYGRYRHAERYDDWDGDRVVFGPLPLPRPLAPPFQGRVELRFR